MPRNVRNFWVEVEIDGQKTRLKGGPTQADGGMSITLLQRDKGGIVEAAHISCYRNHDSEDLITLIFTPVRKSFEVRTRRS